MKSADRNAEGLSTHNPMLNPRYSATVRAISDRYHKLKGLPPLPDYEKVWAEACPTEEDVMTTKEDGQNRERAASMEFAIENTRLSGGDVSEATRALMRAWVRGEIDDAGLIVGVVAAVAGGAPVADAIARVGKAHGRDSDQDAGIMMIRGRGARADMAAALAVLEKVPDVPPEPGDRITAFKADTPAPKSARRYVVERDHDLWRLTLERGDAAPEVSVELMTSADVAA